MNKITKLVREDSEFSAFISCMKSAYKADECLPIAVNGLTGGAEAAFVCESVREAVNISDSPVLILVENESERAKVTDYLRLAGLNAVGYKKRDLVFHNIRASHDVDRERLSVLSLALSGKCDAIVSTPSAACSLTIPEDLLSKLSLSLCIGDLLSPEDLSERLWTMGFARVETVESRGQFSRRGGIVDFFGGESESPVRIEFFGDEIDRLSYFDPITQRTVAICNSVNLLPAAEVMVNREARARMLASVNRLIDKATDENAKAKLLRERAVIEGDGSIDFRDKYLPLIYEEESCLLSYLAKNGKYITLTLGTNNCLEELKKYQTFLENDKQGLQKEGLIEEKYSKYTLSESEYLPKSI